MSRYPAETSSNSNYQTIFDNALAAYKTKTGKDLASDPLLRTLESCDSPDSVLVVLRQQIPGFDQSGSSNHRLTNWLSPTVNVLYTFSSTIGGTLSLSYPPAGVIFTGIASLLSVAQGISASQGALVDIFEHIENVFRRFETYVKLPPTPEMTDVIVKVIVEVLLILSLVTKAIKQGRLKRFFKRVMGRSDIEDALRRIDKLTQEEHRMVAVQALRATHDGTDRIRGELQHVAVGVDDQKREQLLKGLAIWLSPPDPFINYNTASDAHHEGTGVWFTESSAFKDWKESDSLLWIHGKPGAGKSVLTSAIIQDIKSISDAGSAYMVIFFFDFKDIGKQDARALLSSLIVQLSGQSPLFYPMLSDFYSAHQKGSRQPSIDALTKCVEDMLNAPRDIPIYLILDAIDECPNTNGIRSSRDQVLSLVEKFVKMNLTRFLLCVTSRPEVDVRKCLVPLTPTSNCISLHDQSGQRKDIGEFVRAVVYSDENMRIWPGEDKELVIETLSERADGMFRWVICQLEVLRHCIPSNVRRILAELPKSLDETYARILQQIPESNRTHAHLLLQCLTVAVRPLLLDELMEVLAVDFSESVGYPKFNQRSRWEGQAQAVLLACSSLITVVEGRGRHNYMKTVHFAHFSVKEFLTSDRLATSTTDGLPYHHIRFGPAHTIMAQACLSVLLCLNKDMSVDTIWRYRLAEYAAKHFHDHANFEDVLSRIIDGVDDLLDPEKPHFDMWLWLQIGDWDWVPKNWPSDAHPYPHFGGRRCWYSHANFPVCPPRATPLHYVAGLGHTCLAQHLVSTRPQDLNFRDDQGRTPLNIAVLAGQIEPSKLLIARTADLGGLDIEGHNLLHMAAYKVHFEITRMLLERDWATKAHINARNKNGQTPLHIVSQYDRSRYSSPGDHPSIVALLLKFGADVDAQDDYNMTPLHYTIKHSTGSEAVMWRVECEGSNAERRLWSKNDHPPLESQWHPSYVGAFFLRHSSNWAMNAQKYDSMNALVCKSEYFKSGSAAQLLLEDGASVHARNQDGRTPLHLASEHELYDVVALLIKFGAEVDAQDNDSMTPLHCAIETYKDLVAAQLLLDHGASIHLRCKSGQTPLHLASRRGFSDVVAWLLKSGADVDLRDNDDMTPLLCASEGSKNSEVTQLLLEHGASVNVRDKNGQTPLHFASRRDLSDMVAFFLKSGADVDPRDDYNKTPLFCASEDSGDVAVLQLLLEHGASVNVRCKTDQTPLHVASRRYVSLVRSYAGARRSRFRRFLELQRATFGVLVLLLKSGADVDAQDDDNKTPLFCALEDSKDGSVLQLLLEHGASINVRDKNGQTPLHLALQQDLSNTVALLLQSGADVDAQDNDGITPLLYVIKSSKYAATVTAKLLLEHGASVHLRNRNGRTPLHFAVEHDRSDMVALLLQFGSPVDAPDNDNLTPLCTLTLSGGGTTAPILLQHGVLIRNKDGQTPLHFASRYGPSDVVALLLKSGADVNAQDNNRSTPLHVVLTFLAQGTSLNDGSEDAEGGLPDEGLKVVELLLKHGASVHLQNDHGETPLQVASAMGGQQIEQLFLNHNRR